MISDTEIARRFDLHTPLDPEIRTCLDTLRADYKRLARRMVDCTSDNREQALAVTALEESLMWAIASIVRPEPVIRTSGYGKAGGL